MSVKNAFNALTGIHSKPATIKRPGAPDIFTPCRVTPSNFFRYIQGPQETVVHGREFIIPKDSMVGQRTQKISFSIPPTGGSFTLTYNAIQSAPIEFNFSAAQIQAILRVITGLSNVLVSGNFTTGFIISMIGINSPSLFIAVQGTPALDATIAVAWDAYIPFSPTLKRGDKIIHPIYNILTMDEIIELPDIGGDIMGYRVRTD